MYIGLCEWGGGGGGTSHLCLLSTMGLFTQLLLSFSLMFLTACYIHNPNPDYTWFRLSVISQTAGSCQLTFLQYVHRCPRAAVLGTEAVYLWRGNKNH